MCFAMGFRTKQFRRISCEDFLRASCYAHARRDGERNCRARGNLRRAWRAMGLKSPSHSKALISLIARDTLPAVAGSSSIGVPSRCLCWSHNSGVSTPSVFFQSKNTLSLTLNHIEILFPRPIVKAIFHSALPQTQFTHRLIRHTCVVP
jgi:hypothetical protein